MNYRDEFAHNIYNILCIDESDKFIKLKSNILRKHTENLHINGDYSIGLEKNIWKREISSDEIEQLVQSTKELQMPIHKYTIHKNRAILHLERIIIMKNVLKTIEVNPENYGKYNNEKLPVINVTIDYATANFDTVTDCRLDLIKATLENLLSYSTSTDLTKTTIDIKITTKPYLKNNNTLICGIVFDPSDQTDSKKMSKMSTSDYVKKRSIDMQLLAQHKYGLRVQNEKVFIDLIENLGKAAVIVDLMEVKFTAPVGLATVPGLSSSKGAPFILYNSARLETLFRTFNERVEGGVYQSLPLIDEIDLSLLKEEEEWQIFFNFIIEFPNLIKSSIANIQQGRLYLHNISIYLNHLASLFSVYYRRVRILTENREKLIPTMQARLTLIKYLKIVLNKTLKLLNINPITQM